jgi:hypothetical protein
MTVGNSKHYRSAIWRNGAQGRNRTTDTVIFSHVLYQLSYLGPHFGLRLRRMARQASASLTFALLGVHPAKEILLIGWRTGDSIAVAKPFQQVAVLAAGAAEWRTLDRLGPAADRAALGFSSFRHILRTWEERGLHAS